MGLFQKMGQFLFWLFWPVVVTGLTRLVCVQLTGRTISRRKSAELRNLLARYSRAIVKED